MSATAGTLYIRRSTLHTELEATGIHGTNARDLMPQKIAFNIYFNFVTNIHFFNISALSNSALH